MRTAEESELRDKEVYMAGFGLRLLALFLDSLFIALIVIGVLGFTLSTYDFNDPKFTESLITSGLFMYFIGLPIFILLYQTFFESSKFQGTPGKIIMKIKVIDYYGARVSFGRCLLRNASRIIASSTTFMIGYLMVLFTEKQQALHDFIAKTYVIQGVPTTKIKEPKPKEEPVPTPEEKLKEQLKTDKENHSRFMPK